MNNSEMLSPRLGGVGQQSRKWRKEEVSDLGYICKSLSIETINTTPRNGEC